MKIKRKVIRKIGHAFDRPGKLKTGISNRLKNMSSLWLLEEKF
jgi:hypothetical protein